MQVESTSLLKPLVKGSCRAANLGCPCFFNKMTKRKTTLYIDGFNLYYGALKSTPYLWLNPVLLASKIFTKNDIVKTTYCSARVSNLPTDPEVKSRQLEYCKALTSIKDLKIIEGHFKRRPKLAKNASKEGFTKIISTEEKGSDVNLACHLLMDAFNNDFEEAIVVSGDSDLVCPVKMVGRDMKKKVHVLNPQLIEGIYRRKVRRKTELKQVSCLYIPSVRERLLRNSQFEMQISNSKGELINKPSHWCKNYPATSQ